MSLTGDLSNLKKRLKKTALDLVPDPLEDATRYLTRYGGAVTGAVGDYFQSERYHTSPLGQTVRYLSNPHNDVPDIVDVYDFLAKKSDPLRETAFTVAENITRPTDILAELGKEHRQPGGLGAAFRARENTPVKRGLESLIDPMLVAPVGRVGQATGSVGRALGEMALRDAALPAIGQIAGGELGQRIGGDTGGGIGELAGALIGGGLPDPRLGERSRNLITEGFGALAGAVGGFQSTEGEDPYTRAFATLGGGVVGGVLGRRVARGEPIGLSVSDTAGSMAEKLGRMKREGAAADRLDAIDSSLAQSLPARTRAGWDALNRILNDVVNPARNRPEAHRAIGAAGGFLGRLRQADYLAKELAEGIGAAAWRLDTAYESGEVAPKAAYLERVASAKRTAERNAKTLEEEALKAHAEGRTVDARRLKRRALAARDAPTRIDQLAFSGPAIIEHPDEFEFRSGAAQSAYERIRKAYDDLARREATGGVLHNLRDNYINRVWDFSDGDQAAFHIARAPDARQAFQKQSTLTGFLDGLAQGFVPKTMDTKSLYQARVAASSASLIQKHFLDDTLKPLLKTAADPAVRNDPKNWVHLDQGFMKRVFPTIATDKVDEMLGQLSKDVLDAGELTRGAARAARGDIREAMGVGFQNLYLPKQWADELTAQLSPGTAQEKDYLNPVGWLNDKLRTIKLGMDLAQIFRIGPAAFVQTWAANPLRPDIALNVAGNIVTDVLKGRETFDLDPTVMQWARYLPGFGSPGEMGEAFDIAPRTVPKTPVGKVYNFLEDVQFNQFIPSAQVRTAEAIYQSLKGTRAGMALSDDELRRQVGTRVSTLIAGLGRSAAGVSRDRAFAERIAILSPTWARGLAKDVTDVFKPLGSVEGDLARRFWIGVATVGVGTAVAGTMAMKAMNGGYGDPTNPDWDEVEKDLRELLFDPRSERNVWNPDSANFISIELPGGQGRFDFWGPFRPLLRTVASPVTGAVKGAGRAMAEAKKDADPAKEGFQDATVAAVAKAFFGDFLGEPKQQMTQWANGRLALIPRQMIDGLRNKDFFGRSIRTARDPNTRALQQAVYSGASLLPGIAEPVAPFLLALSGADAEVANVVGEHTRAVPEGISSTPANLLRGGLGALGLNARLSSQDPGEVKQSIRDLAASKGRHAGQDPVAWYRTPGNGLDAAEKRAFEAANPHVSTYISQKRKDAGAREDKPFGRAAITQFSTRREEEKEKLATAKRALGEEYRANGISGDTYRDRRNQAEAEYSVAMQTWAKHYFGTTDLDAVYKHLPTTEPFDQFLDEYYSIRPAGNDRASLDDFFSARAEKLEELSPEERQKFFDYQIAKGVDETERQYLRDSQLMAERMRIPQYLGLSLEDGRALQRASQRISDLQRANPGLPRRRALWLDTESDPLTKYRLLQYWSRKIRANPEVKGFEMEYPTLTRFYSTLLADAFADATAT